MIFRALYTLPNSTTSLDTIATQTQAQVPAFVPLMLVFTFFVVFLGGISRQKAKRGTADYPMWAVVAGIATLLVALIQTTITGLISLEALVIVVVVTFFSGVWLFLDRRASEI